MHQLLERYLKKIGIPGVDKLDSKPLSPGLPSEREDFLKWEKILTTKEITTEDLKLFMENRLSNALKTIADPDNSSKKDAKLKAEITIYQALLGIIKSPKVAKEQLEKYLEQLLKQ